jgi:hypothetical protein
MAVLPLDASPSSKTWPKSNLVFPLVAQVAHQRGALLARFAPISLVNFSTTPIGIPPFAKAPIKTWSNRQNCLPDGIPITPALPMQLQPPLYPHGKADTFVNDVILVFLDTPENFQWAPAAVPLAMHIINRPMSTNRPIPREPVLAMDKLSREGAPSEIVTVPGWIINTRRLAISLPQDKYAAWTRDVQAIITHQRCSFPELDSLEGRLNHATYITPKARHFLGRIHQKKETSQHHPHQPIRLTKTLRKDLCLWLRFLTSAVHGISLNLISTRVPKNLISTNSPTPAALVNTSSQQAKSGSSASPI